MGKIFSEEIEGQNNLIKMLLAEPEKSRDAIDEIKDDNANIPIEQKQLKIKKHHLLNES